MNIHWVVLLWAIAFFILQNQYFGWNALPQSNAELLADGITAILFAMAFMKDRV